MKPRHFWIGLGTFVIVSAVFWYTTVGWAWFYDVNHPVSDKSAAELLKDATEDATKIHLYNQPAKKAHPPKSDPKKRAAQGVAHEN